MPQISNAYYRTSVKALVLGEDGTFLLAKAESGKWDLPGGGLDWGEEPQDGIVREIREEMGLETLFVAEHPSYFLACLAKLGWVNNVLYITQLKHLDFVPSDECIEIRFFSIDDAKKVPLFSNVKKFLELYNPNNHN
ncbi:MAG: hypothetical protein A3E36_00705 [Candidatus Andersenbacteria bacterium RIFCSPHIGHO2_12_FULL_45_11b]|uniref:Nudix hydrolase domain-containing protein n=1 Tax=Candidatus Andersenbacteria bacterium RIFCSPHIGHO2_12_FULL_45_11b TaxID=1797282 RepID=A0A1G1X5X4_9BACT|nr:MAG: hypothetical protein A3E36_00705 [Candidatus Andersenbacteria bacterium RIFCSPHIGHO2_12_FULL_45_11b]